MSKGFQRLMIGLFSLGTCFGLFYLDAMGRIDITKFGYAGIAAWVTLILQFYFRKAGDTPVEPKK